MKRGWDEKITTMNHTSVSTAARNLFVDTYTVFPAADDITQRISAFISTLPVPPLETNNQFTDFDTATTGRANSSHNLTRACSSGENTSASSWYLLLVLNWLEWMTLN